MSRIRLDRLMKKLPDGSYEVVGMERIIEDVIFKDGEYQTTLVTQQTTNTKLSVLFNVDYTNHGTGNFIIHDRKDQYTGVDVDGVKVFERDQGLLDGHVLGDTPVTVIYSPPSFKVRHEDGTLYELNEHFYKITGIEGVSSKNINTGGYKDE